MRAATTPSRGSLKRGRSARTAKESPSALSAALQDTPSKRRKVAAEADIYDDIEGAHDAQPPSKRGRGKANGLASGHESTRTDSPSGELTPRKSRKAEQEADHVAATPAAEARPRRRLNGDTPSKDSTSRRRSENSRLPASERRKGKNNFPALSDDELTVAGTPLSATKSAAKLLRSRKRETNGSAPSHSIIEHAAHIPDHRSHHIQADVDAGTPNRGRKAKDPQDHATLPNSNLTTKTHKSRRKHSLSNQDKDTGSIHGLDQQELHENTVEQSYQNGKLGDTPVGANEYTLSTEEESELLETIQCTILAKITTRRPTPLVNLDAEYAKVHSLVLNTVVAGEGNSMLLIGARGSGKSAVAERVLSELSRDHANEFHVVRLSGFFQTDDKIALKEIWRQLGKEMEIEDDATGKSYADTLATLLALLSHPAEGGTDAPDRVAKAVIFIMDEFDLFASHPRQTLLYNLFDIAQSRKAPIAVLGLTTRIDVAESLEKRVKSRFSHRYVHISLQRTFDQFQDVCKAVLSVQWDELNDEEREKVQQSPKSRRKSDKANLKGEGFLSVWNSSIQSLFKSSRFLENHLAPIYHLNKCVPSAMTSFYLPVASLKPSSPLLKPSSFSPSNSLLPPDSKLAHLHTLPILGLSLLIASARLDIIHNTSLLNFNMAYAEYSSLAAKARIASAAAGQLAVGASGGAKVYSREVARREWERLIGLELLVPVVGGYGGSSLGASGVLAGSAGGGACVSGGGWATQMVRCDLALEEIAPSVPKISRMLERWCKQL